MKTKPTRKTASNLDTAETPQRTVPTFSAVLNTADTESQPTHRARILTMPSPNTIVTQASLARVKLLQGQLEEMKRVLAAEERAIFEALLADKPIESGQYSPWCDIERNGGVLTSTLRIDQ